MPRPSTPTANAAVAQSREGAPSPGRAPARRGRAVVGAFDDDDDASERADFIVGQRVLQATAQHAYARRPNDPVFRPLRIYALDPSSPLADGALAVLNVPYEPIEDGPSGPRGATIEIVDDDLGADPATGPLRLDDPFVLMNQGMHPSPEDPRFRQQMAYAVCTSTYAAFRQALGRDVAWSFRRARGDTSNARLRIRPCIHGLQNAYYDPGRGEVRFGTFEAADRVTGRNVPRGTVSLALSHDVVVHEMSHAMLDGLRSHFLYPSNPDVLAFHEGFSDLVALFQRFTYRDVLMQAVRTSRGKVSTSTLLNDIAVQFSQTTTGTGYLRSASSADAASEGPAYEDIQEPHARGEVLLKTVFAAYGRVYERKTAPLLRLASGGTGILQDGEIPETLAFLLTDKAAKLASQFLAMCIRAIDYCPPVDITFGEFLRAVITADRDLVPHDEWRYREAWVEAFAARRIYPAGVASLSENSLLWKSTQQTMPPEPQLSFAELRFDGDPGRVADAAELKRQAEAFGTLAADPAYRGEFGLVGKHDPRLNGDTVDTAVVESIRSSRRVGPSGQVVFDLVAEITQRRQVSPLPGEAPGFDFFGGATVVLDPLGQVRFVIRKSVLDDTRIQAQRKFVLGHGSIFFGPGPGATVMPEASLLLKLHDITRPQLRASAGMRTLMRGHDADATAMARAASYLMKPGESRPWVPLLKTCLARCTVPPPALDATADYDAATQRAVTQLQLATRIAVDSVVGPATWSVISDVMRRQSLLPEIAESTPPWIAQLLRNDPTTGSLDSLDVDGVIEMTEYTFGAMTAMQRAGLMQLLEFMRSDPDLTETRWCAYMLATVKHECADEWHPIEESGKGARYAYGEPVTLPDATAFGGSTRNVFYGRGYVQLTWYRNYQVLGDLLGLGEQLAIQPELALRPDIAYRVMSLGMRQGRFTGKKLATFIQGVQADYVGARRVINGTDRAELIAGYARRFEIVLTANRS